MCLVKNRNGPKADECEAGAKPHLPMGDGDTSVLSRLAGWLLKKDVDGFKRHAPDARPTGVPGVPRAILGTVRSRMGGVARRARRGIFNWGRAAALPYQIIVRGRCEAARAIGGR